MEYTVKTINELCTKITDGSHFSPEHETNGQYPMYSVKDMEYNNFSNADCKMIGQAMFEKLSKTDCRPLKNDILIAKDGSYLKCAFKVNEDLNACILSSIAILRPNLKNIDPDYFVYLMRTKSIKGAMANYVSGSALPRIILSDFKKMKLKMISSLRTQQKIASILSAYDNLIQNYKKQIEALQTAASELYKEWFVRFRFPGYKNSRFENGIPEGWKIERIGNIGEVIGGGTPSTENEEYWDGDIPWLSPVDLSDNTNVYVSRGGKNITKLGLQKSSAKMMPKDTVLLSSRAPVGYVALAKNPICTNQGFKSVVCNTSVIQPIYLYFYFRMNKNYLQSIASGATFPELSGSMMKKLKVLLPQMELQKEFSKKANIFISKAELLSEQITNLTQQRDLLLPRLMRGALEVH